MPRDACHVTRVRHTYIDEIDDERELEGSVQSDVIILKDFIQTALGTEDEAHTDVWWRGTRPQKLVHILVAELSHLKHTCVTFDLIVLCM